MIIIDDLNEPSPGQRKAASEWMAKHFPRPGVTVRYCRVIRPTYADQLVSFDQEISDRVFPDVEQMLLDCAEGNR